MNRIMTNVCGLIVVFGLVFGHSTSISATEPEFVQSDQVKALGLPFSDVVRVGNFLFLSGQIGVLPGTTELADGGIAGETQQAMDNIGEALALVEADFSHVVKCSVFLADIAEWEAFNKVYRTYFEGAPPARSAFGASGLGFNARVEIDCIAALPEAD